MPALTYPTGDFQPFTKILSSEVNGKFNAIKTLLNTTKLDSTNVQQGGLTYDRMAVATSMQIVGTNSTGVMTIQPLVLVGQGGTGLAYTPVIGDAAKVMQVNAAGSALTFDAVPTPPPIRIFNYYRFG